MLAGNETRSEPYRTEPATDDKCDPHLLAPQVQLTQPSCARVAAALAVAADVTRICICICYTHIEKISQPDNFGLGIADHLAEYDDVVALVGLTGAWLDYEERFLGVAVKKGRTLLSFWTGLVRVTYGISLVCMLGISRARDGVAGVSFSSMATRQMVSTLPTTLEATHT